MKELKVLKTIKLSDSEKKELFEHVLNYAGIDNSKTLNSKIPILSPFYKFTFLFKNKQIKIAAFVFLFIFLTSVTAFASLNTIPGDLLYPIKVDVVEKVADLTAFTPIQKAKRNSIKIEKRMNEIEILAERGKLNDENIENLEKHIKENMNSFSTNIKEVKDKDIKNKENLELKFKLNINEHAEKIENIKRNDNISNKHNLDIILEKVPFSNMDVKEVKDIKNKKDIRKNRQDSINN